MTKKARKLICGGCKCSTCRERNAALVKALDILEEMMDCGRISDEAANQASDLLHSRDREWPSPEDRQLDDRSINKGNDS
jgi:hypothetical protein